jgi:hypothetical protein
MSYFIISENLGLSTRSYLTYEEAIESARKAWKLNPTRVGMCTIEASHREDVSFVADDESYCNCDGFCTCLGPEDYTPAEFAQMRRDKLEQEAVYLDAIAH